MWGENFSSQLRCFSRSLSFRCSLSEDSLEFYGGHSCRYFYSRHLLYCGPFSLRSLCQHRHVRLGSDLLLVSEDVWPNDERILGKGAFLSHFHLFEWNIFTMHILGAVGFPRRLADAYHYETFHHLQPLNAFMTWCAIGMVACQIIFAINFSGASFWSRGWQKSLECQRTGMDNPKSTGPRKF